MFRNRPVMDKMKKYKKKQFLAPLFISVVIRI